jgi:hypothetical protein
MNRSAEAEKLFVSWAVALIRKGRRAGEHPDGALEGPCIHGIFGT